MNTSKYTKLPSRVGWKRGVRIHILCFITMLILSGITAIPLQYELAYIVQHDSYLPNNWALWLKKIHEAIQYNGKHFPYIQYGTDWLAFAHISIAIAFIGPLINPFRNIWVLQFGMIISVLIFPFALICGHIRQIPIFWQFIDISLGFFAFIYLLFIYKKIKKIEQISFHS